MGDRLTVMPFQVAMLIAIAGMATDVFIVNRDGMGIEHAQMWRTRAVEACGRVGRTLMSRLREMCTGWRGQPLALPAMSAAVALAVLACGLDVDAGAGASFAVVAAASQLKPLMARDAELKTKVTALTKDRAAIGNAAIAEGRALTADERASFVAKGAEIEATQAQLDEVSMLLEAAKAAEKAELAAAEAGQATHVSVGRDLSEDEAKQPGFFGRQLQAVQRFAAQGGWQHVSAEDRRLLQFPIGGGPKAAATGLNTDVGSEGGFLVGQERASTILQRSYSQGQVLSRVTRMPIGAMSNGMKLPAIDETSRADNSRFGGIVSGWLGQGNTLTSGKPKFREMDLKLKKVGAFVYATDEMLTDAMVMENWIGRYLPLELTFRAEDAVVNGTGSGQPLGVRNSGAAISVTRAAASRIQSDDLRGMWNRMWAPARRNAVWLVDQSTEGEFDALGISIGTGGVLDPSYKPAGSVPGQEFATYKGRPIIPVEYCAALGTSGDIVLVALDEYTVIDRGAVEQAVSMHVAFLAAEQVFRFIYRIDGQLNWNAPLTPKSGGDTLSAAVVLS